MGRGVDEVCVGDERGGEAYGRAVEGCDEDLGVRVEGVRGVEVVGDEGFEPVLARGDGGGRGGGGDFAGDGDVGAAGGALVGFVQGVGGQKKAQRTR